jgi:hypothetical protein
VIDPQPADVWRRFSEPVSDVFPEVLLIIGVRCEKLPFVTG